MDSKEIITNDEIEQKLKSSGFNNCCTEEGRLVIAELLVKAGAGCYNSHTEEAFLRACNLMQRNRQPNKRGRRFLCSMFYAHSNNRPEAYSLMDIFRR